ncbi:leucine--tRNA ligase [Candidatus Micrarchaeota archaeon]|nr:leucine--tRNA ligase [Candidatus Micrarchaeota archaeon]
MDFIEVQEKWRSKWFTANAFEPSVSSEKKFFFTVPYPYVTGNLHVGHGRTYVNADVIVRFKRMSGFNVLWPMGFHITGTPVLAVSDKIAKNDPETIALYLEYVNAYEQDDAKTKEIVNSFKDPWAVVNYFSKKLVQDFQKIGVSIDYSRQFTTGDPEYNAFVQWQFLKYKEKGFLKQGDYPILYSASEKNAVGEDDIKDADTDAVEVQEFISIKSKLGDSFILSSTLRPETVFGITNAFVNPEGDYVQALVDGEKVFCSKAAAEKLSFQKHEVKVLKELKGSEFVGKIIETPLGKKVPLLPASFVNVENASGFVHSVPAHAPYDYVALQDLKKDKKHADLFSIVEGIELISVISVEGFGDFPAKEIVEKMKIANLKEKAKIDKATQDLYKLEFYQGRMKENCSQFAGLSVEQAKKKTGEWLKQEKKAISFYETSRPAFTRHGDKVIAAVLSDQWFLDYNSPDWKKKSFELLDELKIIPEQYKKQFHDVFEWLDKRPCARRRGLGTQLPFNNEWIIESLSDSTFYPAFYTIIKQIKANKIQPSQLKPEFFDFVFQGKHSIQEASKTTGVPIELLQSIKKEFDYWYPCDQRHTGTAHITNHLSFYCFAHTALLQKEKWPKSISLNELVISEGQKMSKSKGNVVTLHKLFAQYPVDLARLYLVNTADLGSKLDFRLKDLQALQKSFNKLIAVLSEIVIFSTHDSAEKETPMTKWMLSKFESAVKESTTALKENRIRDYSQKTFFDLLNSWEYFSSRATPEEEILVSKKIAEKWVKLLSPIMPFYCEELWSSLGKDFVSLQQWPVVSEELIDENAELEEDYLQNVLQDVRRISSLMKNKKIASAKIIVASKEKKTQAINLIQKHASPEELSTDALSEYLKKNFYSYRTKPELLELSEYDKLVSAKDFISESLGYPVVIEKEESSNEEKKEKAMPLKPSVLLSFTS